MSEEQQPTGRRMSLEIKAMARIEKILADLTPSSAQRVVRWATSVAEERVEEEWGTRFDIPADDLPGF